MLLLNNSNGGGGRWGVEEPFFVMVGLLWNHVKMKIIFLERMQFSII